MQKLREFCFGQWELPPEVLEWIAKENLWNLWVPKAYGGLELSLVDGLKKLRKLAKIDGSLGWTVTLCSGANFFIGNLQKEVADEIFLVSKKPIFGGSGGVFGTAEKDGEGYNISGRWKYATGAPYLSHFTLNAKILEGGKEVLTEEGASLVRSFVLRKADVAVIKDWDTMGLKATATHSFEVESVWVDGKYSFVYDELHPPHPIFKVPFSIFADLTLWVNYIGMAAHFLEEAQKITSPNMPLYRLPTAITRADQLIMDHAGRIQKMIADESQVPDPLMEEIHQEASESVRSLSEGIIGAYRLLGIRAATDGHPLNHVFRDYFTATQHHIFSGSGRKNTS
ncbi:MAG TPA: acyl-CoA dehydrogenase [Pricia sp.]|nr:acyl-CoA dehydrogenase [Pricia sp.]